MTKYDYDIGVIGGGAAGLTVASGSSQLGAKTVLVEQEKKLGGDCLHYGCVPSKTLIHIASAYNSLRYMKSLGLPAVEQKKVDFTAVSQRIQSVIEMIQVHDSVERFSRLGVEVTFGKAKFLDSHTVAVGSRKINAGKWLIATGSSPYIPDFAGDGSDLCLTSRDIFSLARLPSSLVVLGAGAVAVEMAQAFARLGCKVTVVQRSDQILSKEDSELAAIVHSSLEKDGVEILLEHLVVSVANEGESKVVHVRAKNGQRKRLVCTEVLAAYGRVANVQDLGLEDAGVKYNANGIEVDNRLRTSVKHIYAAGDVLGQYQFTHAAGYEGGIVLTNAILGIPRKVDYRWMPRCIYSDPEIALLGKTEKELQNENREYTVWQEEFRDNDRALAENAGKGCVKLLLSHKGKPLGIHIVGRNAGDLLAEWVAVVNGKMKLSTLAGAVHPYPTLAEINKQVVGKYFSEKLFSDRVRKVLKMIFTYQGRAV